MKQQHLYDKKKLQVEKSEFDISDVMRNFHLLPTMNIMTSIIKTIDTLGLNLNFYPVIIWL